jgi:hypothetical protein
MTIHDELDFDFPQKASNPKIAAKLRSIMEASGTVIGVPTPVGVERIRDNWSNGEKLKADQLVAV